MSFLGFVSHQWRVNRQLKDGLRQFFAAQLFCLLDGSLGKLALAENLDARGILIEGHHRQEHFFHAVIFYPALHGYNKSAESSVTKSPA
jgi:hypothetical protein